MSSISQYILRSRKDGLVMPSQASESWLGVSLARAYEIQREVTSHLGLAVSGWKLGGTSKALGNEKEDIVWGPIFQENLFFDRAVISDQLLFGAEVEIAMKLSEQFSLEEYLADESRSLSGYLSDVAIAVEAPCSVFPLSASAAKKNLLIADLCASGYVIVSGALPFEDFEPADLRFSLYLDDKLQSSGDSLTLTYDLERLLSEFIKASICYEGFKVEGGQWVLSGALSPLVKLKSAQTLRLESTLFNMIELAIV